MLRYYVDLLDVNTDGKLLGGPITTAQEMTFTSRLDQAGSFSIIVPSNTALVQQLQPRQKVVAYWMTPYNGAREMGRGIIDRVEPDLQNNSLVWRISGNDILRELAGISPGFLNLWNGVNGSCSHATAVSTIAPYAPDWDFTADPSPPIGYMYYKGSGDSMLTLCQKIAEQSRSHFRLEPGATNPRSVEFLSTFDFSSVVATAPGASAVPQAGRAYIADFEEIRDSGDLITRIYPYGGDNGSGGYLTLFNTGRSAPAGYTLDNSVNNYIQNDVAIASYGTISRYVQFPDIRLIGTSFLDNVSASDALFDVALRELEQRSQVAKSYRLKLVGCVDILSVGTTIRVSYRKVINGSLVYTVDDYFSILESTISLRPGTPPETIELIVSSVDRHPTTDASWAVLAERQRMFR